mmetsp:Transcript_18127/g.28118  ORF Transcript_18127/g.28118 Transcript_18127/m.28118 type:complete len:319 (+) Transcript_18127:4325-5281(+)
MELKNIKRHSLRQIIQKPIGCIDHQCDLGDAGWDIDSQIPGRSHSDISRRFLKKDKAKIARSRSRGCAHVFWLADATYLDRHWGHWGGLACLVQQGEHFVLAFVLFTLEALHLSLQPAHLTGVARIFGPDRMFAHPLPHETHQQTSQNPTKDNDEQRQLDLRGYGKEARNLGRQQLYGDKTTVRQSDGNQRHCENGNTSIANVAHSGFPVQSIPKQLTGLKERYVLFFDFDCFTGAGVASSAGITLLHREGTKAAQLDPVAPRHGIGDLVENRVHDPLHIALIKMRIFVCDLLDQLGPDHGVLPRRMRSFYILPTLTI